MAKTLIINTCLAKKLLIILLLFLSYQIILRTDDRVLMAFKAIALSYSCETALVNFQKRFN